MELNRWTIYNGDMRIYGGEMPKKPVRVMPVAEHEELVWAVDNLRATLDLFQDLAAPEVHEALNKLDALLDA